MPDPGSCLTRCRVVAATATDLSFFQSRPKRSLDGSDVIRVWEPENVTPGFIATEVMLGHTASTAVAVGRLSAFATGFGLSLLVRLVDPPRMRREPLGNGRVFREDNTGFPSSLLWGSRPERQRERGLPEDLLRVGAAFSDGRAVTNLDAAGIGTGGDIRLAIRDVGGLRSWDCQLWSQPLPPTGPLGLLCEWPAKGIPETRVDLDGRSVREAAIRAVGRPTFLRRETTASGSG